MFEKWTKKVASKATNGAVDGVKETLNDKLDTYSGIIKIGLTLAVIIFGSSKIANHQPPAQNISRGYGNIPQQPIVINNYISDGRNGYYGQNKSHQKH